MSRLSFPPPRVGRVGLSSYGLLSALAGFLLMGVHAALGVPLLVAGFCVALVGLSRKESRCPGCRARLDASAAGLVSACPQCGASLA